MNLFVLVLVYILTSDPTPQVKLVGYGTSAAACEATKVKVIQLVAADPDVASYGATCSPVAVGGKV